MPPRHANDDREVGGGRLVLSYAKIPSAEPSTNPGPGELAKVDAVLHAATAAGELPGSPPCADRVLGPLA